MLEHVGPERIADEQARPRELDHSTVVGREACRDPAGDCGARGLIDVVAACGEEGMGAQSYRGFAQ